MRNYKKKYQAITIFTVLIFLSFSILPVTQDQQLIVGEWISIDDSNWKLKFNNQGKCYDYYEGTLETTYYYTVTEKTASNGVVFSYLKLVNINDSSDVYNYEINALNRNNLALNYLGDLNEKLMLFEKQ
ncbi:hypothetical protein [Allomuricauda sp. SCSIO 65647]|uniref:hypothetical protein n=1 Tax=Allomuricauda sp. SCSIO 65647 TaxID=2908843 RepID=UPI001F26511E|nr:hypothetical protein [Muricauda sp. SCSIO 65647]UJH66291.1 hypothetical protein L0P89_09940 [Muricauda sp. SCSIO 65647]